MSFNLNDPVGIQALLDELRSSSAWQELAVVTESPQSSNQTEAHVADVATDASSSSKSPTPQGPSVAALLSQLQSGTAASHNLHPSIPPAAPVTGHSSRTPAEQDRLSPSAHLAADVHEKDVRLLKLDDSMPILLRHLRDPSFVEEIKKIKQDQDLLERQLWEERRSIHRKYEEKVKAAKVKASMIGTSVSKHEAEMLMNAHKKELSKFDKDRALPAWDGLISRQQAKLQQLDVPTMYVTSDSSQQQLQQRILQVLIGIIGPMK